MRLIFEGDNVPVVDTERTLFEGGGGVTLPTVTYSTREQSAPTFQGSVASDPGMLDDTVSRVNSIFRGETNITELSQITDNAGLFLAGEFRSGNGLEPGAGFTGGRFGWPGFSYGGTTYFLAGLTNDVLQVGLSLQDGKVYAGAGAVIIDVNGIAIHEVAGDVNGQVLFYNDALPNNFGGLTMWNELFMRLYYYDAATGQTSAVRVDKDNISAHVNSRFRVVDEPTGKVTATLDTDSGSEGLVVYDVSDGTTNVAEILKPYWAMKAVTSTPAYVDGYGRLYLYDSGTTTSLRLRIKDGAIEKQFTLGSSDGIIEATDYIHINAAAGSDTNLRFRENNVTQAKVWFDAANDNLSLENEVSGGDVLVVLDGASPTTENFLVWDRTVGKAIFSVPNDFGWLAASQTWAYASASTFTVGGNLTGIYQKGTKLRWVQSGNTKYGVVASSSYDGGNNVTTVTIFVNNDYTIANALISANFYSYIENPQGFPDWFNWTPTYTCSGSMTYGTVTTDQAFYKVVGKEVVFAIFATGTTGGTASTTIFASPPLATTAAAQIPANGATRDATSGAIVLAKGSISTSGIAIQKSDGTNYGLGTGRVFDVAGNYPF